MLTMRGARIERAQHVELGGVGPEPDDLSVIDYEYQADLCVHAVSRSAGGRVLKETKISADGKRADYWNGYGRRRPVEHTEIYTAMLQRDARGRIVEWRYLDASGDPAPMRDGTFIHRHVLDEGGHTITITSFDGDGNPIETDDGEHIKEFTLDELGRVNHVRYFDRRSEPVELRQGYHRTSHVWDAQNRLLERDQFDSSGHRATDRSDGCAAQRYHYDKQGRLSARKCFGLNGEATKNLFGYSLVFRTFDGAGQVRSRGFYDGREPVLNVFGVHRSVANRQGLKTAWFFFDEKDAEPTTRAGGFASERNKDGFEVATGLITHDGKLWGGTAAPYTTFEWKKGVLRVVQYFDNQGAATNSFGVQREVRTYDQLSRITKREFYDANGAPVDAVVLRAIHLELQDGRFGNLEKAEAETLAGRIQQALNAGMGFDRVYRKYDPSALPRGKDGPPEVVIARSELRPEWAATVGGLAVGGVSQGIANAKRISFIQRLH